MSLWSNIRKHFIFQHLLVQKLFFDKNHWFQLLSTKNDWSISLFLIPNTLHISHPFHHVCCWRRNKLWISMKTLLLLLTKSCNERNFVSTSSFCLSFVFFVFFISSRHKATWFITAWFPNKHLFSVGYILLTKSSTCVFDRSATVAFAVWNSRE